MNRARFNHRLEANEAQSRQMETLKGFSPVGRALGLIALAIFALATTSCDRRDASKQMPDSKDFLPRISDKVRMDKALGQQGELSRTHLTVRWSAGCKPDLPAYLEIKVPREYLHHEPLFLNDKCVEKVYVGLIVPGGAPWPENAQREGLLADPKTLEAHPSSWPKKLFLILRQGYPAAHRRVDAMRDGASDRKSYLPADDFAGLERRLRFSCFSEADALNHPGTRAFLAAKPPDDNSPPNCWTVPGAATLTTPRSVTSNEEAIGIQCHETHCRIHFATGLLDLEVDIRPHDVERWPEIANAARTLARTFVVYQSLDAYESGAKTFRNPDLTR